MSGWPAIALDAPRPDTAGDGMSFNAIMVEKDAEGRSSAGLRRIDPDARGALVRFLVEHREVMSYTA